MEQLISGQRWVSETEPELGLGTLMEVTGRTITLRFDSSDCIRRYAVESAPLKRVIFKPGDEIQLQDKTCLTIKTVSESDGLTYYSDEQSKVCETDLSDIISFSLPQNRLFAGITDASKLFDLRYRLLSARSRYDTSPAKGFLGGQVELIPHQFFIADTVTSRYIPRVLLSDETGLGKTIEACLILHKLLMTHRAERILIIVPESLAHQWFIELYRKFNLSFMIFNQEYCQNLEVNDPGVNPFLEYQLGIISMKDLDKPRKRSQIIEAGWDMVVIDEAHHITDNMNLYRFVQTLSRKVFGLMLLTATPEQMGVKNHFAHLQLLDPERYFDFNAYRLETTRYQTILQTVKEMIRRKESIDHVLDSYGPGRVVFRNKRDVVKGFPRRVTHLIPLAATASQIKQVNGEFFEQEKVMPDSFAKDPRALFLLDLIRTKRKILVICRSKEKTMALENAIAAHMSVDVARFDETMSLLQRDRNAAWFASEKGAQVLICSEIGSEGRNFQFVHNLFLFDLPLNPELLEQRIGRIDRIGQKKDVRIHVPYILGSVYEILAKWFMHGLNLFEKNSDGVHLIYRQFEKNLHDLLNRTKETLSVDESDLTHLIEKTDTFCSHLYQTLTRGKNILLEMNSFKPKSARQLIHHISLMEKETDLEQILVLVLDNYGIETDDIDKTIFKLKTNQMIDEKFPSLSSLSDVVTFDRKTAVVRDDVDFFSWDHPFVQQTFEYYITGSTGSCATAVLNTGRQGVLLETVYILECVAPLQLNLEYYLPPDPIRIVLDHKGNDVTRKNSFASFARKLDQDQGRWFRDLEQIKQILIPSLIEKSRKIAQDHSEPMIKKGKARIKQILGKEIKRLTRLRKINPDVREVEIILAEKKLKSLLDQLSTARIRLDALRLIRMQ